MIEFSKHDIAKIIKRPHRTISYWTDYRIVIPAIQPSEGKGITRRYSERNLIEFGMANFMVKKMNKSLSTVRDILNSLRVGHGFKDGGSPEDRLNFKDFYVNQDWGVKRDLLYQEEVLATRFAGKHLSHLGRTLTQRSFRVVEGGFRVSFDSSYLNMEMTVLWLGKIKMVVLEEISSHLSSKYTGENK